MTSFLSLSPGISLPGSAISNQGSSGDRTRNLLALSLGRPSLSGSADETRRLEQFWGAATLRELEGLHAESDSNLYFESLAAVASRLVSEDRLEAGQTLFAFVAEQAGASDPVLVFRARRELDAIQGRGALGPRLEFLSRRFAREAASPTMLLGMATASAVFSVSRAALLARLTTTPSLGILSRGLGARAAAGLGAFALEAPAFALTVRGTRLALGDPGVAAAPLGHEILGAYLTLGGLKLFGALGQAGLRYAGSGAVSRALLPHAASYFGIVAGHRLEQLAGLRPAFAGDTLWLDSLVTLLQFQVGGRLAQEMTGPRLGVWQGQLNLRSELLAAETGIGPRVPQPAEAPALPNLGELGLAPALALAGRDHSTPLPNVMMMQSQGRGRGAGTRPRSPGEDQASSPTEKNTYQIVQELVRCRDRARRRGSEERSLWQWMRQKIADGAIPRHRAEELQWATYARALYENSPILRREFSGDLSPQIDVNVFRLHHLRAAIAKEQGQESYSLATLVQALTYGGCIPFEKMRQYLSSGTSLDFYLQTPALQAMGKSHFSDPYRLTRRLREILPGIERQREHSYKLTTLVDALRWHPELPRTQLQSYVMVAAAGEFVRALPLGRLRLEPAQLRPLDLEQIFLRLLHLKPVLRGESGEPVGIGYVLAGLRGEGLERIKGGYVNDSAVTNAHVLDFAFNRWQEWGGHFRNLAEIPKNGEGSGSRSGWTRPRYAARFLRKENGRPYSYSYAGNLVRWGEFLWRHREALSLAEPNTVEVTPLVSTRRSRLIAFLEPRWAALREKAEVPEAFFEDLLGLRSEFLRSREEREARTEGEPGDAPSLRTMVGMFFKAKGREIPRTLEVYAAAIDNIVARWPEWRGHFRWLSESSRDNSHAASRARHQMAQDSFLQPDGTPYSKSILSGLLRWGHWVWQNRGRLGLRSGDSTLPPLGPTERSED